jgi:uncharacterized protein (TIGR00266 family)
MQVDIRYSPSFALGVITLPPGGEVKAEAGAMTSMSGGVEIETKAQGGVLKGLKRSVLGGESFFINTFTAPSGGDLTVAPTLPGDIVHLPAGDRGRDDGAVGFVASRRPFGSGRHQWGGARDVLLRRRVVLLRCTGGGDMIVSSFGAIERRDLAHGGVLENRHRPIVAFGEGISYEVGKVGGWKSTLLSGEGLVATFTGPGTLWLQTRSPADFIGWLKPQLPTQQN